jgi:hypothetical protein
MLSYLCEKYFSGHGANEITEYHIAVEALARSPDFQAELDSIVRVEAWRLRRRLRQYYVADGADHPIQVVLLDGGYVIDFMSRRKDDPGKATPKSTRPAEEQQLPPVVDQPQIPIDPPREEISTGAIDFGNTVEPPNNWWPVNRVTMAALAVSVLVALFAGGFWVVAIREKTGNIFAKAPGQPWQDGTTSDTIRVLCGYKNERFIDRQGRTWMGDRRFSGGFANTRPLLTRIDGTRDESLWAHVRMGDFRYDIPLKPGMYELHLYFSELLNPDLYPDSDGEDRRRFNVLVNGAVKLSRFDIVTDAGGPNVADERVFKDISPTSDGELHLEFKGVKGEALLNRIEILPSRKGQMRPVGILCGTAPFSDSANETWKGDSYFFGGVGVRRISAVKTNGDPNLYAGERYGRFAYAIPVAEGTYSVTLRFAEFAFGPNDLGRRLFEVSCNGTQLLRDFDILREAGGERRAIERTFHGLKPNAQGKLWLSFVPTKNYASVSAVEVMDESK